MWGLLGAGSVLVLHPGGGCIVETLVCFDYL